MYSVVDNPLTTGGSQNTIIQSLISFYSFISLFIPVLFIFLIFVFFIVSLSSIFFPSFFLIPVLLSFHPFSFHFFPLFIVSFPFLPSISLSLCPPLVFLPDKQASTKLLYNFTHLFHLWYSKSKEFCKTSF